MNNILETRYRHARRLRVFRQLAAIPTTWSPARRLHAFAGNAFGAVRLRRRFHEPVKGKLTIGCYGKAMRLIPILLMFPILAACAEAADEAAQDPALIAQDPVIARALHDPLMSDPDLASRNEANAALGFPDSHALPVLAASTEDAQAAREAQRLELLEGGTIPELPLSQDGEGTTPLGPMTGPADLLAAVGAPASCAKSLREDFALAASLPPAAAIPQRGMVMQAGGADAAGCWLRIIRYHTAAPVPDVLQYHLARMLRAGMKGERKGDAIIGTGKGAERVAAHVRAAPNGLTGVTLVYRAN
ncbi:MAG: hypothetical protein EAY70_09240 [Sphingomonadales bacterium]|nr:MAG: hypothetical protein EAY70_09240 [Sphingomonadales bacterium]